MSNLVESIKSQSKVEHISLSSMVEVPIPSTNTKSKDIQTDLDYFGIIGSALCFIHCLAMPFVLPYINFVFGNQDNENHAIFHFLIFPFLLFLAATSISKGFQKHHNKYPVALATIGLILMGLTLVTELLDIHLTYLSLVFNITGSISLIIAHSINLSLTLKNKMGSNCSHIKCSCKKNSLEDHE